MGTESLFPSNGVLASVWVGSNAALGVSWALLRTGRDTGSAGVEVAAGVRARAFAGWNVVASSRGGRVGGAGKAMEVALLSLETFDDCAGVEDTLRSSLEGTVGGDVIAIGDSDRSGLVDDFVSILTSGDSEELLDSGSLLTVVRVVTEVKVPVLLVVGCGRVGASSTLALSVGSSLGTSFSLVSPFLVSDTALLEG